jgi:hypothetical protein
MWGIPDECKWVFQPNERVSFVDFRISRRYNLGGRQQPTDSDTGKFRAVSAGIKPYSLEGTGLFTKYIQNRCPDKPTGFIFGTGVDRLHRLGSPVKVAVAAWNDAGSEITLPRRRDGSGYRPNRERELDVSAGGCEAGGKRCAGLIFFAGFDSCDPGKNNLQPVFKPPSFRAPYGKFPQPIPACPQGTGNIRSFRESNCPASAEHNEKFS